MVDRHPELPVDPDTPRRPLHLRPVALLLVLVGGAVGTLARDGLVQAWPVAAGHWPWPTFTANVLGSFVLGVVLERLARLGADTGTRQRLRLLLGTGFCGGFTTYSTFAVETDLLVSDAAGTTALVYAASSLLAGAAAAVAGIAVAARGRA